jgi:hypothetical protein
LRQVPHAVTVHAQTDRRAVGHWRAVGHAQIADTLPGRLAQVDFVGHAIEEIIGGVF